MKKILALSFLILQCTVVFSQNSLTAELLSNVKSASSGNCLSNIKFLQALPEGNEYRYQWLKDGVTLGENISDTLNLKTEGLYQVLVSDSSRTSISEKYFVNSCSGFSPLVEDKKGDSSSTVSLASSSIIVNNPVICGNNTSSTLTASPQGAGYTYQWYYSTEENGTYTAITGAVNATHITTTLGWYKLYVNDGVSIPALSSATEITESSQGFLTDMAGNIYPTISTTAGTPTQVKLNFTGDGPVSFSIYDQTSYKEYTSGNTSPHTFTLQANQNRQFYLNKVSNSCATTYTYSPAYLEIDASTSLTLPTPASTNVCAGETIEIPYTTIGTWDVERQLSVYLIDQSNNTPVASSYENFTNPIQFNLPSTLTLNSSYKIEVYSNLPRVGNSVLSNYTLNVTSTGCSPSPLITVSPANVSCGYIYMETSAVSGATYQWFKDNVQIPGAISSYFQATASGNYKVQVINSSTSYNQTSANYPVTVLASSPVITSTNPVLCGSNTSATLSTSASGLAYQWMYAGSYYGSYSNIPGATSATHTTAVLGFYIVKVDDGVCQNTSTEAIQVSDSPQYTLFDSNDAYGPVSINTGQTAQLKLQFYGTSPYLFTLSNNLGQTQTISTSTNPYLLNVQPDQNTEYYINSASNECGNASSSNNSSIDVNVNPAPNFVFSTPSTTTACIGGRFEIPFTKSGTWGTVMPYYQISLEDNNGNYISNSTFYGSSSTSSLYYEVPSSVSAGTYNLRVRFYTPNISSTFISNYSITLNSSGCVVPGARIEFDDSECAQVSYMEAYPRGSNYSYQWYKDGVLLGGQTYFWHYSYSSGTYTVQVTDAANSYASTSPGVSVSSSSLADDSYFSSQDYCSAGAVLTATDQDPAYTYQWYYSATSFGHSPISNATGPTYTTTQGGSYFLITKFGNCESKRTLICPLIIDFVSKSVCQQSAISVPFVNNVYNSEGFKLQLLSSTGTLILDSLSSISAGVYPRIFNFNLPASVSAGTYKFRVVSTGTSYSSSESNGTLTVTSSVASQGPTLMATPTLIDGSGQTVTLTASNCTGTVYWSAGYSTYTGASISSYLFSPTTFYAYCLEPNGCSSALSTIDILNDCIDAYEPNNSSQTANLAAGDNFVSSAMCFNIGSDSDWFYFVHNGKKYYIKSAPNGGYFIRGNYIMSKSISGNTLTIETSSPSNANFDTVLSLFDSDGTTQLAYDNNGNGSGLSKITYTLTNPCQNNAVLSSTVFDVPAGETSTVKANNITGSNKLDNTSIVNYRAEDNVLLNPGFETLLNTGGTFKAEIKDCNN